MDQHTGPGTGSSEAKTMSCEEPAQRKLANVFGRRCKKLNGVKAEVSGGSAGCLQVLMKHERATASLLDQTDSDSRTDHV
jgi:hypothetical protein